MKQQAKNVSPWKLGALTVLCALLFTVFACTEEKKDGATMDTSGESKMEGDIFVIVEELPEFGGGMDAFYNYVAKEMSIPWKHDRRVLRDV